MLLGLKTCLELGLVKRVNVEEESKVVHEYKDVFQGLGRLKKTQYQSDTGVRTSDTSSSQSTILSAGTVRQNAESHGTRGNHHKGHRAN